MGPTWGMIDLAPAEKPDPYNKNGLRRVDALGFSCSSLLDLTRVQDLFTARG
jgi:hypothetical protein